MNQLVSRSIYFYVKTLSVAAVSGALLVAGTLLVPSTAVAVDLCHGQPASVSPGPDGSLVGTAGPDVIVAHSGQRVEAGDGDDLICVVTSKPASNVDAGPGNDTVDTTRSSVSTAVSLGEGEDTFAGGRGVDAVWGSAPEGLGSSGLNPPDTERDVISTGGGDDKVFSGSLDSVNSDKIATGSGTDRIDVIGLDPTLELDAGAGRNIALVTLSADETTAWLVDVAQRKIQVDDGVNDVTWHWQGQLPRWSFHLAEGSTPSSLVFLGTRGDENAFVSGAGLVPHFRMGPGDDWAGNLTTPGGTYFLGAGHDKLTLGKYDDVAVAFPIDELRVNLGAHRARFGGGVESPVWGVETLLAGADLLRVRGSARAERVVANGCRVVVRGLGGNDRLRRGADLISPCDPVVSRLYGGRGHDILWGSQLTDDLLVGGRGFDRARGMKGTDTCFAEVERGCELG